MISSTSSTCIAKRSSIPNGFPTLGKLSSICEPVRIEDASIACPQANRKRIQCGVSTSFSIEQLVQQLKSPNGALRDLAQQWIIERDDPERDATADPTCR